MAENPDNEDPTKGDDGTEVDSAVGTLVTIVVDEETQGQDAREPNVEPENADANEEAPDAPEAAADEVVEEKAEVTNVEEATLEETEVKGEEPVETKTEEPDKRKTEESEESEESKAEETKEAEAEEEPEEANAEVTKTNSKQEEKSSVSIEQVMIKSLMEKNAELEEKVGRLHSVAEAHLLARDNEVASRKKARENEVAAQDKMRLLEAERESEQEQHREAQQALERRHREELVAYKEQIRQHSLTIVGMEDRISRANRQSQENELTIEEQRATLEKQENHIKEMEENLAVSSRTSPGREEGVSPREAPPEYSLKDVYAMEQLVLLLRRESADLKVALKERDDTIVALRKDLIGAQAKLSDMTGELSEEQKVLIENLRELTERQSRDLLRTKEKLSSLSAVADSQTKEIESLNANVVGKVTEMAKMEAEMRLAEKRMKRLREEAEEVKKENSVLEEKRSDDQSLTKELANLGAQCRGERHAHVIQRQREALGEMRAKIKSLELGRPPSLAKEETLQQVAVLKRELSELRAQQAVMDNKSLERVTAKIFKQSLEKKTPRDGERADSTDGAIADRAEMMTTVASASRAELEMEKSAHRETIHALETSERAYFNAIRAASSVIDIDASAALKPMSYAGREEREKLFKDRQRLAEILAETLKGVVDNARKSDAAVQSYAVEYNRLKDVEEVGGRLRSELEMTAKNLQKEFEENKLLRESLRRTKESLNFEKRLNASVKEKKQFYVENPRGAKGGSALATPTPAASGAAAKELEKEIGKRKTLQAALKKKDDEIRSLKLEMNKLRAVRMDSIKRSSQGPERF